jgi:hypothetical protein
MLHLPKQNHPPATVKEQILRLDPLGTFFLLPCVVSLLLALQWGGSTYPWSDARIIALFVLFGVLLVCFIVVEIKLPKTATLPPRVVANRSIIFGAMFTFFLSAAMLIIVYFLPLWCKSKTSMLSSLPR